MTKNSKDQPLARWLKQTIKKKKEYELRTRIRRDIVSVYADTPSPSREIKKWFVYRG